MPFAEVSVAVRVAPVGELTPISGLDAVSVSFSSIASSCFSIEAPFARDAFTIYEPFLSGVMVTSAIPCVLVDTVFWLMIICEDGSALNVTG